MPTGLLRMTRNPSRPLLDDPSASPSGKGKEVEATEVLALLFAPAKSTLRWESQARLHPRRSRPAVPSSRSSLPGRQSIRRRCTARRRDARARLDGGTRESGGEGKGCHPWKGGLPPLRPTPAACGRILPHKSNERNILPKRSGREAFGTGCPHFVPAIEMPVPQ